MRLLDVVFLILSNDLRLPAGIISMKQFQFDKT